MGRQLVPATADGVFGIRVGRNSSIGNSTAIRFHMSSGTRQTVGTRRRLLLRPAAIHTSTPSPCDVQRCRTPWRAGDPALNHLWDRLLGRIPPLWVLSYLGEQ